MINRELIRLKLVQIIYSYYQNGSKNIEAAEKELELSLSRAYKLYASLLSLMVEVGRMGLRMEEMRRNRARRLGLDDLGEGRFGRNRFIAQLENNKQLLDYVADQKISWADHENFVRALYTQIEESPIYEEYLKSEDSYASDREVWRKAYRQFICNNDALDDILEEMDIYWNDDKAIVDTFVLKTINRFTAGSTADQPLLPQFQDDTVQEFAVKLLRHTLSNAAYYDRLISGQARNWTLERIALMDRVIMQVALAEILTFPSIPLSVSINEYVELAKLYSTPKSGKYVNATLDHIAKSLMEEGKIAKDQ